MSTQPKHNPDDQEIDLSDISRKFGDVFQNLNTGIFRTIQFFIKNAIIVVILFALGIGIGFYLDKTRKSFEHQIIVKPNFGSVDYLYSRIDLINSKITEKDTNYLKTIGIAQPSKISKIEIKPIVDVYKFVNNPNSELNFQLLKLMSENGDIKKIMEESTTSKNYRYHAIEFKTRNLITKANTVDPLMNYINNNPYFAAIQKQTVDNTLKKIEANDQIIAQIDGFLNQLASGTANAGKSMVYINENTQLNDVIETKDKLLNEQGYHRVELVGMDKIIKDNAVAINIENNESINGKMKIILPLLFVGLFILFRLFRSFYRNQKLKSETA